MTFNSTMSWGWPAKALRRIGAAIILVLLAHGCWMTHMTPRPDRLANDAWRSALGYDLNPSSILQTMRVVSDAESDVDLQNASKAAE